MERWSVFRVGASQYERDPWKLYSVTFNKHPSIDLFDALHSASSHQRSRHDLRAEESTWYYAHVSWTAEKSILVDSALLAPCRATLTS